MLTTDTPAQVKATNGNKLTPWKMSHCNFLLLLSQTLTKEKYIYVCNGGQLVGTVQINLTRLTLVAVAFSLLVSASASRVRSGFETRYMLHTHIYIYYKSQIYQMCNSTFFSHQFTSSPHISYVKPYRVKESRVDLYSFTWATLHYSSGRYLMDTIISIAVHIYKGCLSEDLSQTTSFFPGGTVVVCCRPVGQEGQSWCSCGSDWFLKTNASLSGERSCHIKPGCGWQKFVDYV